MWRERHRNLPGGNGDSNSDQGSQRSGAQTGARVTRVGYNEGPLQEAHSPMSRPFVFCALALLAALPIVAQTPCNLDMSMTCVSGNCTAPTRNVPSLTQTDVPYTVSWSPVVDTTNSAFVIEESTTPDFSAITDSRTVNGLSTQFRHIVNAS